MSDILSATALEDAAKKVGEALRGGSISKGDDGLGALLRHLRALTAPADGEALGRLLGEAIDATMGASAIGAEDIMQKAAIRLHAIGHAAGALSREGEIAALREDLEGERRAYAVRAETERTEIARLTAELAGTRGVVESFQRNSGCVDGYTIGEALAKIGASLDRTPTEGIPDAIERLKRKAATARDDGAREGEKRILRKLKRIGYPDAVAALSRARGDR